ncbi:hypothetical protein KKH23_10815 [Patescibacteria group bacterium]|nr:hypothetical protein [Patescibacteria group bacterium]
MTSRSKKRAEKKEVVTRITNKKFAEADEFFNKACGLAEVKPTSRQASKFRLGKGLAYKFRKHVLPTVEEAK